MIRYHLADYTSSSKTGFLGDAEFPRSAEKLFRGGRIRLYEHIYQLYSRLAFTNLSDRSVAISGLEKRLIRTFDTRGGYGVFLRYLDRSLLWRRKDAHIYMQKVAYTSSRQVPSWSWMAYDGEIEYLELPFGEIQRPSPSTQILPIGYDASDMEGQRHDVKLIPACLTARAQSLAPSSPDTRVMDVRFDTADYSQASDLRYVILAWDSVRKRDSAGMRYWVLAVMPHQAKANSSGDYQRVGAGYIVCDGTEWSEMKKICIV